MEEANPNPFKTRKSWTPEELATLLNLLVEGVTKADAAEKLGRSVSSLAPARKKLTDWVKDKDLDVDVPSFKRPKGTGAGARKLDLTSVFEGLHDADGDDSDDDLDDLD